MNARVDRWIAGGAAFFVAALFVPGIRRYFEADMARHMLIEFPLLIAAGWAIAGVLPARLRSAIDAIDRYGLAIFTLASMTLALWMIPVALDASLDRTAYASAKYASLALTGLMLRGVGGRSPLPVQAFFVGGIAWMTATVGLIYQDAPQPLCLYYLADMQQRAGFGLVVLAIVGGALWCAHALRALASGGRPSTARGSEAA